MRKMMSVISRICLVVLLLGSTSPAWTQASLKEQKAKGFTTELATQLQQIVTSFVNDPARPYVGGMAVAVKVGDVAYWQGAAGYAFRNVNEYLVPQDGGTPFTVNTPSQIYSITKTFTAALVVELVRERVLSLNAHVSQYIDLHAINPKLSDVTIHQLLAHESGYSDFYHEPRLLGALVTNPYHQWKPEEALAFVQQIAAPGKPRHYSNTNYIMLGAIVEKVTGVPIAEHFRTRYFQPLGLTSMYLRGREEPVSGTEMASPHDNLYNYGLTMFPNIYTNIAPAMPFEGIASLAFTSGGIVSTVADVAKWGDALFNGKAVPKEVLNTMLASMDNVGDKDGDYLGYGIWKSTRMSTTETFIGHDGSAIGYRSVMFYQPEKKMTIAILSNDYSADLYAVAKALYAAVPNYLCTSGARPTGKLQLCYNGKLQCVDYEGAGSLTDKGAVLGSCGQASVQQAEEAPAEAGALIHLRAYPNPVDNRTVFTFQPEQSGPLSLRLYDINGKMVSILYEGLGEKGVQQQVVLERGALPAGIYFGRLQSAAGISQYKVVLSR